MSPVKERTRIARSKADAMKWRKDKLRFGYEAELIESLQHFLTDIGAARYLSEGKEDRLRELKRFHEKLSVDNYSFPEHIPFDIIYPRFFTAVVNSVVERKANNVAEMVRVFRAWINIEGKVEELQRAYERRYPEAQPAKVTGKVNYSDADLNGTKLEDWPDQVITDQYKKIEVIYRDDDGRRWLDELGGKGYIARLKNEAVKRGIINQ